MRLTVVIPVRNRLDLTKPIVSELRRQGGYDQLIVYDNGSDDGTDGWLAEHGIDTVNAAGKTIHQMWNHGIERAIGGLAPDPPSDAVVFLNNDLELDGKPDWLTRLVAPMDHQWDAVSPRTAGKPIGKVGGRGLVGFAFAVHARFLKDYRFPEELKWHYGDTDLFHTLDEQRRVTGVNGLVSVTHIGGGSQTAKDHELIPTINRDRDWFQAKWVAAARGN